LVFQTINPTMAKAAQSHPFLNPILIPLNKSQLLVLHEDKGFHTIG
jgi:hypothetical protein